MSGDKIEGISNGPNARPLNDTISGSGPGIPDDALLPGEEVGDDAEVENEVRALKAKGFVKPAD
jgi:hypothetical protein